MKRLLLLLWLGFCIATADAGYEYADRVISNGEYVLGLDWLSGVLVIDGGGADVIEVRDSARIEVWSTSAPLGTDIGGIMDLAITNTSHLDYYGGLMQELTVQKNATAQLRGGRIDGITSMQFVEWVDGEPTGQHILIYAKDGWEWQYENGKIKGITGLWSDDGSRFDIRFINHPDFDSAWSNIKVVPEPATLLLFGAGGICLFRRRCRRSR